MNHYVYWPESEVELIPESEEQAKMTDKERTYYEGGLAKGFIAGISFSAFVLFGFLILHVLTKGAPR